MVLYTCDAESISVDHRHIQHNVGMSVSERSVTVGYVCIYLITTILLYHLPHSHSKINDDNYYFVGLCLVGIVPVAGWRSSWLRAYCAEPVMSEVIG